MKTPEEILKNWSFYGKIPTRELEKIIEQAQTEAWNEGAIEELTKAKCLTEHLNQQERNEYFETRLKKLAE